MKKSYLIIGLMVAGCFVSGFYAHAEMKSTVSVPVTVHAHDTLWTICEREADLANDKRDLREIVYETIIYNQIKNGGTIQPGQKIMVRVQK